jgi:hypothetical protein
VADGEEDKVTAILISIIALVGLPPDGASFVKVTVVYLLMVSEDAVGNVYGVDWSPPSPFKSV